AAIAEGRLAEPSTGRNVPAWLRPIVLRGLRADPARRWPSMDAVVTELTRLRNRRRNLGLAIAGVLAAVAITIVVRGASPRTPSLPELTSSVRFNDGRDGCNCPYSGCRNGCVSVCRTKAFRLGTIVPGISRPGRQE